MVRVIVFGESESKMVLGPNDEVICLYCMESFSHNYYKSKHVKCKKHKINKAKGENLIHINRYGKFKVSWQ